MKQLKITGFILAIVQLIVSLVAIYYAMSTKMMPFTIGLIVSIVLILIPAGVLLLAKKKSKKTRIAAIIISAVFIIILVVASYYLSVTTKAIDSVTGTTVEVDEINVYVAKEDEVSSINEAIDKGYVFGLVATDDQDHINETIEKIESDVGASIKTREYETVIALIGAFEGGAVQSFITNTGSILALDSMEEYIDYSKNLKVIMENTITEEIKEEVKEDIDLDHFCVYFSGIDTFGSVTIRSRSDVNIIGVVNNNTKTVLLVSTPRDYYVDFPNGKKDKLTHAGIYGDRKSVV